MLARIILITCIMISGITLAASANWKVGGYIKDNDAQALIGATILYTQGKGAVSDLEGYFQLQLPSGKQTLVCSYTGMQSDTFIIDVQSDTTLFITLQPVTLTEVLVTAQGRKPVGFGDDGVITLSGTQLEKLPTVLGERELIRALQLLPGVQSGNEGARGIFVRGGGPDQNLILYEGAPVFNVAHLYGVFSVFNSDITGRADLHKNYLPPRFGGRLASAIEVDTRPANMDSLHGGFQLGLFTSKAFLDVPLVKDKLSAQVAIRGCYAGLFSGPISERQYQSTNENGRITYFFYDLNAALYGRPSDKHSIEWHIFHSDDRFRLNDMWQSNPDIVINNINRLRLMDDDFSTLRWNNLSSSFRWKAYINPSLNFQQDVYWSRYFLRATEDEFKRYQNSDTIVNGVKSAFNNTSFVSETGIRGTLKWTNGVHQITTGYAALYRTFNTGQGNIFEERQGLLPVTYAYGSPVQRTGEADLFFSYRFDHPRLTLDIGGRSNYYSAYDGFDRLNFQPRGLLEIKLPKNVIFQFTGAMTAQNMHLLANSAGDILNDIWVPANATARPENAIQGGAGIRQDFPRGYSWSADVFYRKMDGLIEYNEGASYLFAGRDWLRQVATGGVGRAYGLELFATKTKGNITAWAKYTLSRSERQFDQLNRGLWFPFKYDRTHDASFSIHYAVNKKLDFSLSWVYGTGNTFTLSTVQYPSLTIIDFYKFVNDQDIYLDGTWAQIRYYEGRNNYRLKAFHHLDVGMNYKWERNRIKHTFNFSVYNVYNRLNVFNIYLKWTQNAEGRYDASYHTLSLMPVLPSFSYAITF